MNNENFAEAVGFPVASVQFNYEQQIIQRNSSVTKDTSILAVNSSEKEMVKIYPNPVKDHLIISGIKDKESFEIYTLDGKQIKTGNFSADKKIDVNILPKGVYLLKVANQNLKFIKD